MLEFLDRWRAGHDLVLGVRRTRSDGQAHQMARRYFYRILRSVSQDNIQVDSGDFRLLIVRRCLNQLREIYDASPYLRGLTSLLATNPGLVLYDRRERQAGQSKFPLRKLIALAVDALLAHLHRPASIGDLRGPHRRRHDVLAKSLLPVWPGLVRFGLARRFCHHVLVIRHQPERDFSGNYWRICRGRIYAQVRFRPTTVIEQSTNIDTTGQAELRQIGMKDQGTSGGRID